MEEKREHIMVCLSASPSNPKIIRCAAHMAEAYAATFTALYVESAKDLSQNKKDKENLQKHMDLARSLGAQIETIYGEDVSLLIAQYARLSGVTRIVIGRSSMKKGFYFWQKGLTEQLIEYAPDLDIHIIPDQEFYQATYHNPIRNNYIHLSIKDSFKSIMMLALATMLGIMFSKIGLSDASIMTIYILSVLLIALMTTNYSYCLMSSIIAVIVFNFLFTEPKYTLLAYDAGYPITFLVMFFASCLTGNLASRLKKTSQQNARAAFRTQTLLDTEKMIAKVNGMEAIAVIAAQQIVKLSGRRVLLFREDQGQLSSPRVFTATMQDDMPEEIIRKEGFETIELDQAELEKVRSVLHHSAICRSDAHNTSSDYQYYAIRMNKNVYGVLGVYMQGQTMDPFEESILCSILGECALALENEKNAMEKDAADKKAQNEQIRADLLRSISHDLRTPLTTICGNADNLLTRGGDMDQETKESIYLDIYDDALWLNNLVENLLSISRIEGNEMNLHMSPELLEECIQEALKHLDRKSNEHVIKVNYPDEILLVNIEARLIMQVIINLINNAIKYTPKGSTITVSAWKEGNMACLQVADNGPGVNDEYKERIFEMFYSGHRKIIDSKRSLGLGLALCKSIILAHGGEIMVKDNEPCGSCFIVKLKLVEDYCLE